MFLLRWNGVNPVKEAIGILLDLVVTVRMQKTQQLVNNLVSEEALELIGFYDGEHEPEAKVFPDFWDKMTGKTFASGSCSPS